MRVSWVLLLAGCPKAGERSSAARVPSLGWEELFVPARYDYEEITASEGEDPIRTTVTEEWTREEGVQPPEEFPGTVWAVDDSPDEGPTLRTLFVAGERGLAYFATVGPHGAGRTFAPKILLPARLDGETRWEGSHGEGPNANTRACHVEPTPYCDEGAAVACETRWAARAIWMRQHFCRGLGWVAYESVTVAEGRTTRTWSEEATRDGEALPFVGIALRPMPEVTVSPAPAR